MSFSILCYFIKRLVVFGCIVLLPIISHAQPADNETDDAQQADNETEESPPVDGNNNVDDNIPDDVLSLTGQEAMEILFPGVSFAAFEFYIGISAVDMRFEFEDSPKVTTGKWSRGRDIGTDFDVGLRFLYVGLELNFIVNDYKFSSGDKDYYFNYDITTTTFIGFAPLYRNYTTKSRIELFASYGSGKYEAFYSDVADMNYEKPGENGVLQSGDMDVSGAGVQFVFNDKNLNKSYFALRLGRYNHEVRNRTFRRYSDTESGNLIGATAYQVELFGYFGF